MTPSAIAMSHELSDAEWAELAGLIEEAPPGRVRVAMRRVPVERLRPRVALTTGDAVNRALLRELRRLSVH